MNRLLSDAYVKLREFAVKDMHNTKLICACKKNTDLLGEFLQENRKFIFSIIIRYRGSIEELKIKFRVTEEDIYQHACIGLLTALKDFDVSRGIKFTTYVVRPILWEVNQLLYSNSQEVRLSRGAIDMIRRMAEIEDTLGYRPNEQEMAEFLQVSIERYREVTQFSNVMEQFEALDNFEAVDNSQSSVHEDVIDKIYVKQLLCSPMFTEHEKTVMHLIMQGANNSQIAEKIHVYPMTISRTLARIRKKIVKQHLDTDNIQVESQSKYKNEINLIIEKSKGQKQVMNVTDITDALEVSGYDTSRYSKRVLYYIRKKANLTI
ncbi:sigma-70 family RNA polymerase sigma factor [Paenibacillus sp. FSL M7-0802]|uniref:sigma-70 family RNA polymerase sigma factor n=1 Tax=Paenibacillus TaxID=44249 RepID=UPI001F35A9BC|nr:sigma-70 family RNA polymerase sigma factor [Paenibacillus polymyxa]